MSILRLLCLGMATQACLFLPGCSSTIETETQDDLLRMQQRAAAAQEQLHAKPALSPLVATETMLRFTSKSVPFDASQMLPSHIQTVTMKTTGLHGLRSVAQWIEHLTRIPVIVTADALLPAQNFELGGETSGNAAQNKGVANNGGLDKIGLTDKTAAQAIQRHGGPRQLATESDPAPFSVDYNGPLQGLLDQVATRAGVRWAYQAGRIRFYRVVSRSIPVRSLPGNLTQSGGVTLGSGMSLTSDVEMNIWDGIEKNLQTMVSRQGRFRVDSAVGFVTVRDSAANVEAVERYLDGINRLLSRQVSLNVEVLQVSLSNRFESGIDWNYVREVAGMGTFRAGSLPVVTGSTGSIGFVKPNSEGGNNTLLFQALEKFGKVSTSYSSVINTMNRQPVPLGAVSTQSYLKQITPTTTPNAAGGLTYGPPGLTPGEIQTGFNITLLPIVLDSNMVLLQCNISISALKEITTISSGTGLAQQTLQTPSVSSFLTQQRMAVRSGDTIVLSGFENEVADYKQNDLKRDVVPGTRANAREKSTIVVVITPRLLDF